MLVMRARRKFEQKFFIIVKNIFLRVQMAAEKGGKRRIFSLFFRCDTMRFTQLLHNVEHAQLCCDRTLVFDMRASLRKKVVLADNSSSPVCGNDVIRISDQSLGVALITHLIVPVINVWLRYCSVFVMRYNYVWTISVISIGLAYEITANITRAHGNINNRARDNIDFYL